MSFFVLSPHQVAGTFWRDKNDIEIGPRFDLLEVNVEPMRKKEGRALINFGLDRFIQGTLYEIRCQKRNDCCTLDRIFGFPDLQPIGFGPGPARASGTQPCDDIEAAVFEV
jgi:hypothetical protein